MREAPESTVDEVLASKVIATPYHRLDCLISTDDGGAVVGASADAARRLGESRPAWIRGSGEYHGCGCISQAPDLLALVTLAEGPRMMANVVDCDVDAVRCDMRVEVAFEERDGRILPQFRPA